MNKFVSVVTPTFNEIENIELLYKKIKKELINMSLLIKLFKKTIKKFMIIEMINVIIDNKLIFRT
jgi:hypothetical protein